MFIDSHCAKPEPSEPLAADHSTRPEGCGQFVWLKRLELIAALLFVPALAMAGDWPQWCGKADRNMASDEKGLPDRFDDVAGSAGRSAANHNLKWSARLGGITCGSPVIAGGKVFIGGAGADNSTANLWCLRESDGQLLWKMRSPFCLREINRTFGICSAPTVEGNRVYVLSPLGEVLCLDADGRAGRAPSAEDLDLIREGRECLKRDVAPDGRRIFEITPGSPGQPEPTDAHIVWRYDMLREVNCWPYNAESGAILVRGDHLFVPTGSVLSPHNDGSRKLIDEWMEKYHQPKYDSPSLIVLDKHTGKLLAREREDIFMRTFHGAHSSPALGKVNGQELVFYGGGGGTCYAFDPNFAPSRNGEPAVLKLVWKFDCVAAPYDSGKPRLDRAEVIATPVFYRNRIYVSIGNDLEHSGDAAGPGRLLCVDATQTGDITATGKIWSFDTIGNTASTVAVADGLLYTADAAGNIYCLDAETGELYWQHKARSIWSSPLVADGKVFVADNTRGLLVLAAGKEKNLLSQLRVNADIVASPAVADGVLYIASARYLYALQKGASAELAVPAQPDDKLTSDKVKETQLYPEQRRTKLRRRVAFGATVALGVVVALAIVGGGFRRFKRSRRRR